MERVCVLNRVYLEQQHQFLIHLFIHLSLCLVPLYHDCIEQLQDVLLHLVASDKLLVFKEFGSALISYFVMSLFHLYETHTSQVLKNLDDQ